VRSKVLFKMLRPMNVFTNAVIPGELGCVVRDLRLALPDSVIDFLWLQGTSLSIGRRAALG